MCLCVSGFHCIWDGYFVDIVFFHVWFKCPWAVATDFGKYLRTSLDVNTFHDWKKPLLMAHIHVDVTWRNAVACRYCISSGIDGVWCTLLLCSSCDCAGDSIVWAMRGILHQPFLLYLGPWTNILLLCFIVTCCALNTAMHPSKKGFVWGWVRCVPHMLHRLIIVNRLDRV